MSHSLDIKGLGALLCVSRMTIHRMRKAGELPPPIPTRRRFVRWLKSDIDLWLELDCPNESDFKELKATKRKFSITK